MRWVADTGPVLHLVEAGASGLLPLLGDVAIPLAVVEELNRLKVSWRLGAGLRVVPLNPMFETEADGWHHSGLIERGEAHAIALARQIQGDVFLTDDAAARLFAASLGLHVRGSLGVVLWLAGQRKIDPADAARWLERLAGSSLWVSARVLAEAREALRALSRK